MTEYLTNNELYHLLHFDIFLPRGSLINEVNYTMIHAHASQETDEKTQLEFQQRFYFLDRAAFLL